MEVAGLWSPRSQSQKKLWQAETKMFLIVAYRRILQQFSYMLFNFDEDWRLMEPVSYCTYWTQQNGLAYNTIKMNKWVIMVTYVSYATISIHIQYHAIHAYNIYIYIYHVDHICACVPWDWLNMTEHYLMCQHVAMYANATRTGRPMFATVDLALGHFLRKGFFF